MITVDDIRDIIVDIIVSRSRNEKRLTIPMIKIAYDMILKGEY